MSKYETGKAAFEKEWKEKRKAAEKKWKEGSTKGKKSTVGGGKQGVRTETPELMKAPKKKAAAPPAKAAPPPANETRAEKQAKTRARVAWEKQRPDENYREWKARLKGGMPAEKKAAEKKATPPAPAPAKKKGKKAGEGMGYIKEAAKRTKGTKAAPHMVRHTKAPAKAKRAAASFTEKAGVAQDIGPWKPTDRKATKPKVSYKKPKKTPFGMKKGGSVKKKSKSSTVGGGKQGVKTVTPKHMKAPPAKRTKGTKAAPHMVKHSMGSLTGITTAEDWSKMRKMDAELDREWEKAVPSSYQGKGHGRKVVHGNKGAHRKRKGGSVDAQWGGYDFKDGGRIPGIRPTRKGT